MSLIADFHILHCCMCICFHQSCCDKHFSWNEDCITKSSVAKSSDPAGHTGGLYYPSSSAHECLSDGNEPQSDWSLYESIEVCVTFHCSNHHCVRLS